MYLVFTRMPSESYRRRVRSLLLCLCDVFPALINSLVRRLTSCSRPCCSSVMTVFERPLSTTAILESATFMSVWPKLTVVT